MNTLKSPRLMLMLLVVSACHLQPARMYVPSALADTGDRYPVKGQVSLFVRRLRFGPYRTRNAWVGAASGSPSITTILDPVRSHKEKQWATQKGRFTLVAPSGASFRGECRRDKSTVIQHDRDLVWDSERKLHMADEPRILEDKDVFRCSLTRPSAAPLELMLERGLRGTVRGDGVEIDVSSTSEQENQPFPNSSVQPGFLLAESGHPVAAVDLTAASSVTLPRNVSQEHRDELAAVCMALLLLHNMD